MASVIQLCDCRRIPGKLLQLKKQKRICSCVKSCSLTDFTCARWHLRLCCYFSLFLAANVEVCGAIRLTFSNIFAPPWPSVRLFYQPHFRPSGFSCSARIDLKNKSLKEVVCLLLQRITMVISVLTMLCCFCAFIFFVSATGGPRYCDWE